MPLYEYQCHQCKNIVEEYRNITEDSSKSLNLCINCNILMQKILSNTFGYVKGSTFPVKQG